MTEHLVFRHAEEAELAEVLSWAANEGWNPGLDDHEPFWAADPGGYFLADADGKIAAAISLVRYPPDIAFLGLYIAAPDFRGKGIGHLLWKFALSTLPAGMAVGLDGVVAQQENYKKSGFAYAHANYRYAGHIACEAPSDTHLVEIDERILPVVRDYDRTIFRAARPDFLTPWLAQTPFRRSLAYLANGRVVGFGTIRRCRDGGKIGPLFAESEAIAESVFCGLSANTIGPVFLDVPGPNLAAVALARRYGMLPMFETARMYRGMATDLPLGKIFGITTFELG
jgi:GNAT superfamily N-acetyltransferase